MVSLVESGIPGEVIKIEKEKGEHMQDVHRAKAELSTHSSAYRSMAKASQMGH